MKRLAKRVLRTVLMLLALALVAGLAVGAVFAVRGYNLYRQAADERPLEQMVAEIQSQETYVPFEDLPDLYVDAVVSVEDKRFWSHPGVDPIAICRALLYDIQTQSLAQGGSTSPSRSSRTSTSPRRRSWSGSLPRSSAPSRWSGSAPRRRSSPSTSTPSTLAAGTRASPRPHRGTSARRFPPWTPWSA